MSCRQVVVGPRRESSESGQSDREQ